MRKPIVTYAISESTADKIHWTDDSSSQYACSPYDILFNERLFVAHCLAISHNITCLRQWHITTAPIWSKDPRAVVCFGFFVRTHFLDALWNFLVMVMCFETPTTIRKWPFPNLTHAALIFPPFRPLSLLVLLLFFSLHLILLHLFLLSPSVKY